MTTELISSSTADLPEIARQVLAFAADRKVWLLEGEMGAGKTTFIKAVCSVLGVAQTVQSPTFALVNEYATTTGDVVYHFDFYRIKKEEEALDMGVEEYFYSGDYCFVEWPSQISGLWPEERLDVHISERPDGTRLFQLTRR
ncbi:tRNA (adenosine(37)-N6)-threonylcarbamoyltransferase complex ATPase subunit type 1 TsaE [Siphonobacter aquaeclarae]|uniref:tRNA threonylcarbamoyladenosine biosynthesis protein TsaE n=1 Tax=Siphonobacter aquaeclarae TaxID=563176 RepID=A0A1G9U1L7_9BACT|nr:tRNA (adenosine(37)-N6)-threonylcarbamoyltransferase complex ATPase subunit type 1 TsaE [Siphonobacter aquaeclarae]SDM53751.1 tRNA threonylcarbamoyladenosine biosynthesis protein TsaE [Siphonobacter aquaeclarae]